MTRRLFIAIGGYKGAGKNTLTNAAVFNLFKDETIPGLTIRREMFAAPLKEIAAQHFGWQGSKDPFYRALLQLLGDDLRSLAYRALKKATTSGGLSQEEAADVLRKLSGTDASFDPLIGRVLNTPADPSTHTLTFITDCRMDDEFALLASRPDTLIVWIDREGAEPGDHITEQFDPAPLAAAGRLRWINNVNGHPELGAENLTSAIRAHMQRHGWPV
ncbi:hypothetical protein IHN63_00600 [Deinococcus sp. 6YEL10]|uniref:hypothetical protein n=1 Tax=Deinococcus sp. 6YEL10 TaxID=2745870 RepID=UPI001E5D027A|nr:hypothetical protein [Deinococcus sp. 6YEL10]MCD0159799.1 hypothetical protein [Deinococcus sp. 6YEL10]